MLDRSRQLRAHTLAFMLMRTSTLTHTCTHTPRMFTHTATCSLSFAPLLAARPLHPSPVSRWGCRAPASQLGRRQCSGPHQSSPPCPQPLLHPLPGLHYQSLHHRRSGQTPTRLQYPRQELVHPGPAGYRPGCGYPENRTLGGGKEGRGRERVQGEGGGATRLVFFSENGAR